jgi:predicted MFS family arabinose efflux permease
MSRYAAAARASAAGVLFPLSLVAGWFLGKWLGQALGWGLAPAYVGAVLGVVAGFWNLYRILRGLESGGDTR